MTQFKDMKIRIKDSEHSKAVQDCLFELGYGWLFGARLLSFTPDFIYTYVSGLIREGRCGYDEDNDYCNAVNRYNRHNNSEVTLEQLQAMVAEQSATENASEDKFMPEATISTYMSQLQDLFKNAKVSVTLYGDEFHVCNMDNDDEVVVKDWDSVLEAVKAKQNYLSVFGK